MMSKWLAIARSLVSRSPRDPAPVAAQLREHDPVCWIPGFKVWLISRHDDVRQLLADSRLTPDPRAYDRYKPPLAEGAARWLGEMPFRSTPANPNAIGRRLVLGALTPRAVERAEERIGEVVDEFAHRLHDRQGTVDLRAEFTAPVSAMVIARLLGVPPKEDAERFGRLARRATRGVQPHLSLAQRAKSETAAVEIADYILALVAERRENPGDDLISDLVKVSREADVASDDDIVRTVSALVSVGTGTASLACIRSLRSLLLHPSQLERLRGDRALLANGIEELLRYDSGVIIMPRYVLEDLEVRGRRIKRGQLVALSLLGGNRDPRVFTDPERLDVCRDTKHSLSFGQGQHYCPGASIARVELRRMIDAALDFLPPGAKLLEDQIHWSSKGFLRQMKSLPVEFPR